MFRASLMLAGLAVRLASGAGPAYSSDSILNGSNFTPAPFAPNSIISVFGSDLSFGTATMPSGAVAALPYELANVRVYVDNISAPLLYVSPTQINLLVPGNLKPASVPLRVVRQGVTGPEAMIRLAPAAPQLFATSDGFVIAQHADYSQITAASPATSGEIIIVYATGLGPTQPNSAPGEVPQYPGLIVGQLDVFLDGTPVSPGLIQYAGLTPGSAGVYQVNLQLPDGLSTAVEIRIALAGQTSAPGVLLPVQPPLSE